MVYTVLYKTSSFAGYCFLDKNSIHPKRYGVFSFKAFKAVLVKIQICSFIVLNKRKHKISFETAAHVFDDPEYIEMYDFEHSTEEDRYIALGKVGDILFVVFTERKEAIRLISARLATDRERRLYYDQEIHY